MNNNTVIDTGYMDSHEYFGLNTPESERLQYRRVLHCAPLSTENYTVKVNVSNDRSYTRYLYGPGATGNWTYEYSNDSLFEAEALNGSGPSFDYSLGASKVFFSNGSVYVGEFMPIPELQRPDADLGLAFMSADKVAYTAPVHDPWFRATERFPGNPHRPNKKPGSDVVLYHQSEPASPLGCATQEQFCLGFPDGRRCSPLSGSLDSFDAATALFQSHSQAMLDRYHWLLIAVFHYNDQPMDIVGVIGLGSLMTRLRLNGGSVGTLPDN